MGAATVATSGIQVAGTLLAAQGQQADAKQQAAFARQNQQLALRAAADTRVRGEQAAGKARTEGSRVVGEAKAALGASGVDAAGGSAQDAMATTRMFSELDAQTLKNNAAREAWGLNVEAANIGKQALALEHRGRQAAIATLLTGGAQVANTFASYKRST